MRKATRLDAVVRHTARCEEQAARVMAESRRQLAILQNRIQLVDEFKRDYTARVNCLGGSQVEMRQVSNLYAFIADLDKGMVNLAKLLADAEREVQRTSEQWRHARARKQGIEKVLQRQDQANRRAASRQQQRRQDEHRRNAPL